MTIILSLVTSYYSLQVSDRLLSEPKGQNQYKPWDPASNKSVVVLTRDGLISMGYTGPAFISRIPMDGWIAEAITGEDPSSAAGPERGGSESGSVVQGRPRRLPYRLIPPVTSRSWRANRGGDSDSCTSQLAMS
jgi:hypothetical protein